MRFGENTDAVQTQQAQNPRFHSADRASGRQSIPEAPEAVIKVPADYTLSQSSGRKTGRWFAQLEWAPDGEPSKRRIRLAERPTGMIELDRGGREAGSRSSTFTRDRQTAVDIAVGELQRLIRARLEDRKIDEEVEEAGGDLTLNQAKRKVVQLQTDRVKKPHLDEIKRVFDITIALRSPEWSVLLFDGTFVDDYIKRRTSTTIVFPPYLDRPNPSLPPCGPYKAAKELHTLAAQIRMLANEPRAPGEKPRILSFCAFDSRQVLDRMPDPKTLMGPPKRPLHAEHLLALIGEWTDQEGTVHPSAVDAVDPSGGLRLMVATLYDQARRRESATMLRRRNIALTEAEVRAMLERINGPIRPEWTPYFVNGITEWEGEVDKEGFHRVYPNSSFYRAELELYDRRVGWMKRDPNEWLFQSPTDPTLPLATHTLYNTPEPQKAESGEEYLDASGQACTAEGGEICHFENGEVRYKRKGGRYQRAVALLRHRLRSEGRNPDSVFPVYSGEVAHPWRDGWAVRTNELGYGRTVKVDDKLEIDLDQNADYLGDWAVGGTVKHERYVSLHPVVLMGIVEGRGAKDVVEDVARVRAEENRRIMDALARLRDLHHGATRRAS